MDKLDYDIEQIMDAIPQDWWYNRGDDLLHIVPEEPEAMEELILANWWMNGLQLHNKIIQGNSQEL